MLSVILLHVCVIVLHLCSFTPMAMCHSVNTIVRFV